MVWKIRVENLHTRKDITYTFSGDEIKSFLTEDGLKRVKKATEDKEEDAN